MLNLRKNIFLTALLVIFSSAAFAQELGGFNTMDKYQQRARIGLVNEFFKRFNGIERHPDLPSNVRDSRKKNLMMLYNLKMFKSQKDKHFKEASQMMDVVIKNKVKINYQDTAWCAKALCDGTLNGKPVSFYLYLTVEHRGGKMYKWTIAKAEGKIFDSKAIKQKVTAPKGGKDIMILPDAHETNFMSLSKIVNNYSKNIERIVRRDYSDGQTASFVGYVYNNRLKINYVRSLEFIFEQIPGYEFKVAYFQKGKSNLGWLISSFKKTSDKEKGQFLKSLYSKRTDLNSVKSVVHLPDTMESIDIADSIVPLKVITDSIDKDSACVLSGVSANAILHADSVICMLIDPMSTDSIKALEGKYECYEILQSKELCQEATAVLKAELLYPGSFELKDYVKDCTFLPDVVFVFYTKGAKSMIFAYSFYCDICKINSDGKPVTLDGENIRDTILQITADTYPKDRYIRRIAGKSR